MPDTLTPEELRAIRERDADRSRPAEAQAAIRDRRALLRHIDALAAAARWLVDNSTPQHTPECWLSVDEGQECICGVSEQYIAVLAILRGEQ